jgi:uncharacterized protein YodC (DUF2158 family)
VSETFKIGETVHLNSDIPNLTVFEVKKHDAMEFIVCRGNIGAKIQTLEIPAALLKAGSKPTKPAFKRIKRG